jgi:hypothetical protein
VPRSAFKGEAVSNFGARVQSPRKNAILKFAALLPLMLGTTAEAIDLQPGDTVPLADGTNVVQLSYVDLHKRDLYSNGNRISTVPSVATTLYQARFVHYFSVAGMPMIAGVQQPWGEMHSHGLPGGNQHVNGYADTVMLLGLWPYVNRDSGTYLAVGAYYYPKDGSYSRTQNVNLGENRSKSALQTAFQTRVAKGLDLTLAADVTRNGDNSAFGITSATMSQANLYTLQSALNYALTSRAAAGITLLQTYGGETSVNGSARHDRARTNRFVFTTTYALPEYRSVLTLNYGRDLDVENGLLESRRLIFRFTRAL